MSIRAVRRVYAARAGIAFDDAPEPKDIYAIGKGEKAGRPPGRPRGLPRPWARPPATPSPAPSPSSTGWWSIGGGLTGAAELFLPALVAEMNAPYTIPSGALMRLEMTAFNLEDPEERARFVKGEVRRSPSPAPREP